VFVALAETAKTKTHQIILIIGFDDKALDFYGMSLQRRGYSLVNVMTRLAIQS